MIMQNKIISLVIIGLVVGGILHFLLPDKRQQGVAQVIDASILQGGFIRFRDGIYSLRAGLGFAARSVVITT